MRRDSRLWLVGNFACGLGVSVLIASAPTSHATEQTDNSSPLKVGTPAAVNGAGQVNDSVFVALATNAVSSGATFAATATLPSGSIEVPVYSLPVGGNNPLTGSNNATVWIPTPADASDVRLSWSTKAGDPEIYGIQASAEGASINLIQDADGSRSITVTTQFPRFSGFDTSDPPKSASISQAFFERPSSENGFGNYGFYVFDAETREVINPDDRPGVRKRWISDTLLEIVDPLVLPSSALGRNIRVGFVTYYYLEDPSKSEVMPIRYAGLSTVITMKNAAGGGGGGGGGGSAPEPAPSDSPIASPVTPTPAAPTPTPAVVAPEIPNPAAVTAQEIESFTSGQVALIPPSEFRQLPPAAIGALSPQQVSALTPAQVNSLRPARAAAITPTAAAAMNPTQLEALRPAAVRALPAQTLAALDGPQLASLRPDAVARITPQALRALSPAQLRSLTSEQRERLTPRQLRALDPLQRAALT